ncbi:hypothetical protein O181_089421 [Austropuccinia psidii MF-1]|uniref:Uncharacterized protein n=1 Tax=Austropuccinia psidii MF-1 TaxID=1389203 RepID=A0A9Q3ITJ9_9BASI|nr:hypothetical protein [Austropuccinia psidii MF-1]
MINPEETDINEWNRQVKIIHGAEFKQNSKFSLREISVLWLGLRPSEKILEQVNAAYSIYQQIACSFEETGVVFFINFDAGLCVYHLVISKKPFINGSVEGSRPAAGLSLRRDHPKRAYIDDTSHILNVILVFWVPSPFLLARWILTARAPRDRLKREPRVTTSIMMKDSFTLYNPAFCLCLIAKLSILKFLLAADDFSDDGPIYSNVATSNLIFASFSGLLQQWPNTFYPSGHSIVPGIIPRGTLLYHGTNKRKKPSTGIEWLAFDPEMSYAVHACREGETGLLTYTAQRPLRIIYIDGQSGSVGTAGNMDSQSLLINDTVTEEIQEIGPINVLEGEYRRAKGLCQVGKNLGFEGVVPVLENWFANSTAKHLAKAYFLYTPSLTGSINTTDPFQRADEYQIQHNPVFRFKDSPLYSEGSWESGRMATFNYHSPGESRVKLDFSGFISFYDRVESLTQERIKKDELFKRSKHRLYGISQEDIMMVKRRIATVLSRKNAEGWEIIENQADWQQIVQNIIQRYSTRLLDLQFLLNDHSQNATKKAMDVRRLTYALLMPYLDFSTFSLVDFTWLEASVEKCRASFTATERLKGNLTQSIRVLIGSIEETLDRLCRTVKLMFAQAIELDLPYSYSELESRVDVEQTAQGKVRAWTQQMNELIAWLGWPNGQNCEPSCSPNEICIIPMWPASRVLWDKPFKYTSAQNHEKFDLLPIAECLPWNQSKPLAKVPAEKVSLIKQLNLPT